jgi:hypothetical protein
MPKIPTVRSRAEIVTRAPGVRQPVRAARRIGEGIIEAGKTLEGISEVFSRARDLQQYTRAGTEIDKKMLEIKGTAANTPINSTEDFENIIKTSTEELQKVKNDILPKISNPETRLKMEGAFDLSELRAMNAIKGEGRGRWVDMMKADAMGRLEALKEIYVEEPDPTLKKISVDGIKELINNHIEVGVFNKTQGQKLLKNTLESLPALDAENMIDKNPVLARELINKGLIEIKDPREKEKLLSLAETTIERNKTEAAFTFNIKQAQEEDEAANMIIEKSITSISQIDKLPRASEEFKATAKKLVLSKKKIDPEVKLEALNEIEDDFYLLDITVKDKKEFSKTATLKDFAAYRIKLMNYAAEGLISEGDYKRWSKKMKAAFDTKLEGKINAGFISEKNANAFMRWWTKKNVAKNKQLEAQVFLKNRLIEEIEKKPDMPANEIPDLTNQIIGEYLGFSPDVKEEGTLMLDPVSGERAIVYPDNSYRVMNDDGTLGELMESKKGK